MIIEGIEVIVKPEVKIEPDLVQQAKELVNIERQVIVHVLLKTGFSWWQLRIWPSTFLIPREGGGKSRLLNADKIPFYPQWLHVFGSSHSFTLIFEALPKDCEIFDLAEEIPQQGGFEVKSIKRNQSDVYHIEIID